MNAIPPMLLSEAHVQTDAPRQYLTQLCKHFQHKVPVALEESRGRIEFPAGICELDATDGGTLTMRVMAGDEPGLATLEDVVTRHLKRFAFRQEPGVRWTRAV